MVDSTSPQPRAALAGIPAYKAGRPPASGAVESYKLSSNENPYPPLAGVIEAAAEAVASFNRYPDMGVSRLHAAIADRFGVDVARVASGAGSVAVLYHLLQAMCDPGDEVVYAWRSFEAYPIAVGLTGARSVQVPLTDTYRHDLPSMLAAITDRTKVVLVCTPNNPTGPAVHRAELEQLLDSVPRSVVVVIDEAYREFTTDPETFDGLEVAGDRPNVVVLRTFSKAYGLAGLRIGYGVAPEPLAEAIRKCALPFGVSQIAQAAGVASLAAEPALLERVALLVEERARVMARLAEIDRTVPEAQGNFYWLPLGSDALPFAAACEARGVSVRAFDGDGVRVSIGEQAANDTVIDVLSSWGHH
jgi:histidinol-phosphate aminotransferase